MSNHFTSLGKRQHFGGDARGANFARLEFQCSSACASSVRPCELATHGKESPMGSLIIHIFYRRPRAVCAS